MTGFPPPCGNLGVWTTLCSRAGGNQCRSGGPRLATALRGPWSISGGSRPAPLPSLRRRPCCQGALQLPADEQIPLPPPAAITRAVAMAELASPQTWKPPARWILQCLSTPPKPGSPTQRTMHGCVTGKSATGGAGLGGKTARALWKACEQLRKLVEGGANTGAS